MQQQEADDLLSDSEDVAFLFDIQNGDSEGEESTAVGMDLDEGVFLYMNAEDILDIFDESGLIDENGEPRCRNPRGEEERRDPKSSVFGKLLQTADAHYQTQSSIWDESHRLGIKFRRRYRVPFAMFEKIARKYEEYDPRETWPVFKWYWVDVDGEEHEETGLHMICDGGYHRWKILICPYKDQLEGADETIWSGLLETMRKDIECIFGILKKRFLILKNATRLHNFETLGHVFRTCCILHNMLLEHDGWDDWRHLDNLLEEEDIEVEEMNQQQSNNSNQSFTRAANPNNQLNLIDADVNRLNDPDVREALHRVGPLEAVVTNDEALHDFDPDDFHDRRAALIEHYMSTRNM